jgi:hypothetical protein
METSSISMVYYLLPFSWLRASPVILYHKPESGKRWKDVNYGSGQQGRSLYLSFIYRLEPDFGRFFTGACNRFWNVLLREDTQVWENDLQGYRFTRRLGMLLGLCHHFSFIYCEVFICWISNVSTLSIPYNNLVLYFQNDLSRYTIRFFCLN